MSKYRQNLPQLKGGPFLTDGGLETVLIFHHGLELPLFASFDLMKTTAGRETIKTYFEDYIATAQRHNTGFILESPTWRANADWAFKLGYSDSELAEINKQSIALMQEVRVQHESAETPIVISGCVGPRGDGYVPSLTMTAIEAEEYHAAQVEAFESAGADVVSALTMNYVEEAIGITHAARKAGIPVVISFTLETDGKLPTGQSLGEAIREVDEATGNGPAYYMINCAHPTHFAGVLPAGEPWLNRIQGLRANASCRSHAELDEAADLDDGNPEELGRQYRDLRATLKNINVFGGCCGTDHRHVAAIAEACL